MIVGTLCLSLRLAGCRSLKDKRQILRSTLEKARRDFGIAIAEVGDHDLWGNAVIAVSCVSTDVGHAESILQSVVTLFEMHPALEIESAEKEIERR